MAANYYVIQNICLQTSIVASVNKVDNSLESTLQRHVSTRSSPCSTSHSSMPSTTLTAKLDLKYRSCDAHKFGRLKIS